MKKTTSYLLIGILAVSLTTKMNAGNNKDTATTTTGSIPAVQAAKKTDGLPIINKGRGGGDIGTFSAAANLNYLSVGGIGSTSGIGAQFIWNRTEKISVALGIDYYFPVTLPVSSTSLTDTTTAQNSPAASATVTDKLSFLRFNLNGQYYFVGDNEDDFNVYGLVGVGVLLVTDNTTIGNYDKTKYISPVAPGSAAIDQLYINLGIGAEYKVGPGRIFLNTQIHLPPNSVNGQAVDANLGLALGVVAGYRYTFGDK